MGWKKEYRDRAGVTSVERKFAWLPVYSQGTLSWFNFYYVVTDANGVQLFPYNPMEKR